MANMFFQNNQKNIPRNLEECYRQNDVSADLRSWGKKAEKLGKVLFIIIIIAGIIVSLATSITSKTVIKGSYYSYTDTETDFNFQLFLIKSVTYAIYAFAEYCIYHIVVLLMYSLAEIVQNSSITANIALYNSNGGNSEVSDEADSEKVHTWRCSNCGNITSTDPCSHCGFTEKPHDPDAPNFCGNCGKEGPFETDTCPNCGSPLKKYNN